MMLILRQPIALKLSQDGIQLDGSIIVPLLPLTPIQDGDVEMQPNPDDPLQGEARPKPQKKAKRVRLLLDARTELTDEELKVSITVISCVASYALCVRFRLREPTTWKARRP